MKLGLAGNGYWGSKLKTAVEKVGCEVVAIYDEVSSRRNVLDYEQLLNTPGLEGILIATPPHSHFSLAKQALERDLNVFLEKPMALVNDEAEELVVFAKKKKLVFFVDFTFLYTSELAFIKNALRYSVYGKPTLFRSTRTNLGPFKTDVGVVEDLAPHDLSLLYELFGCPLYVSATASSNINKDIYDDALMTFTYSGGFKANIHVSWLTEDKRRKMEIITDTHLIYTNFDGFVSETLLDGTCVNNFRKVGLEPVYSPLEMELNYFKQCVKQKNFTNRSAELGAWVTRVISKIMESISRQGSEVRL